MEDPSVLCRVLMADTLFEIDINETLTAFETETTPHCIPVVNNAEIDDFYPVDHFPRHILDEFANELGEGRLFVRITKCSFDQETDSLNIGEGSEFIPLLKGEVDSKTANLDPNHRTSGTMTVAIVRVHTTDSHPTPQDDELDAMLDATSGTNFVSQFQKCSRNSLNIARSSIGGVINIYLDKPVAAYGTGSGKMVSAAQAKIREQFQLNGANKLADKVLFCLPPGSGKWVASAGLNHWRAQFNDQWCTSLTAVMHELGHTMGLLHSNEGNIRYADSTGYMSRAYRSKDGPLRCFNGQNNDQLGWYSDLTTKVTLPVANPDPIKLAAFVDEAAVRSNKEHSILINVADSYFLQYNRAKYYNIGTGEYPDMVTVTTKPMNGGSQLVAALSPASEGGTDIYEVPNFVGTHTLVLKVCRSIRSNGILTPDVMEVIVALDSADCGKNAQGVDLTRPSAYIPYVPPSKEVPSTSSPTDVPTASPVTSSDVWPFYWLQNTFNYSWNKPVLIPPPPGRQ